MDNPWLYRYAVVLAVCTLLLLISGAWVTDYDGAPAPPAFLQSILVPGHRAGGVLMGILTLGLAIWLSSGARQAGLRLMGWILLAIVVAEAALGTRALTPSLSILHAGLAQLFFAGTVAMAVLTSRSWNKGAETVQDQGWPSLRSLSTVTLAMVLVQVVLGASFRHKAIGLMSHIVVAMLVALLILIICMFVMQQFPEHRSLKRAANFLMTITLVQVFLGIAAISMRMMTDENTPAVLLSTIGHVSNGGLTLAGTLMLVILIRRNVRRDPA